MASQRSCATRGQAKLELGFLAWLRANAREISSFYSISTFLVLIAFKEKVQQHAKQTINNHITQ
jgi:hypothetical protein